MKLISKHVRGLDLPYQMYGEKRTELPRPWELEPRWFWEQVEGKIQATGYKLRRKDFIGDLEFTYNNSVVAIRALNHFLDCSDDDLDGLLDAFSALNTIVDDTVYHVRASRGFRERFANHLGWKLELAEARPPTEAERRILDKLLRQEFPGREEIRNQLRTYLVSTADENGSLSLYPDKPAKVPVVSSVPAWGKTRDADGVMVYVRLHVIQGWVKELEIARDDASHVMRPPEPQALTVHHARSRSP